MVDIMCSHSLESEILYKACCFFSHQQLKALKIVQSNKEMSLRLHETLSYLEKRNMPI